MRSPVASVDAVHRRNDFCNAKRVISELEMLEQRFPRGSHSTSGRHHKWEVSLVNYFSRRESQELLVIAGQTPLRSARHWSG